MVRTSFVISLFCKFAVLLFVVLYQLRYIRLLQGMDNVQDNTCVTFRPKVESDKDWMEIKGNGSGCSAIP